jgi:hypothetical protein
MPCCDLRDRAHALVRLVILAVQPERLRPLSIMPHSGVAAQPAKPTASERYAHSLSSHSFRSIATTASTCACPSFSRKAELRP